METLTTNRQTQVREPKTQQEVASRPPLPPFTRETAIQKVRMAEDGWNSRDPEKVALAYTAGATGVATGAITDSPMMSSSAASAFRGGGAGAIRTDITVTTITRTITMDTAGTHIMDTAGTVTTVAPVMGIAMEAERVMDMAMAAEPVTDTAMAADQGTSGVRGVGDKPG